MNRIVISILALKRDAKLAKSEVNLPTADGLDGRSRYLLMKMQNTGIMISYSFSIAVV